MSTEGISGLPGASRLPSNPVKIKPDSKARDTSTSQIATQNFKNRDIQSNQEINAKVTYAKKDTHSTIIELLQLPIDASESLADSIVVNSPDLSKLTSDGKNVLHLAVNGDLDLLRTLLNQPQFNHELVYQKDHNGHTPLDLIEQLEAPVDIKFQKKYMLILSGFGAKLPERLTLNQFNINTKILTRLALKGRETKFFEIGGLCNGYSFLHNFYTETKGEEYFNTSLLMMSLWDGSEAMLELPIPPSLPQSVNYRNLDELFEQWTNDLFFSFASSQLNNVIPNMEQHLRSFQYEFLQPHQAEATQRPTTIYYHEGYVIGKAYYSSLCDFHMKYSDITELELKQLVAESKSHFLPTFVYLQNRDQTSNTQFVKFFDLDGNEKSVDLHQHSSNPDSLDSEDFRFLIDYLKSLDVIDGQKRSISLVTKERMLELVKYLSHLPEGIYIDVGKSQHSTTFRQLPNGSLGYYNCDDKTPTPEMEDFKALNDAILEAHGHTDNSALLQRYPNLFELIEGPNSFIPHAYHFNRSNIRSEFEDFSIFSEEEYPRSKEDAFSFQQTSANGFTHMHIAILTHDLNSVNRLLQDGFIDLEAKDVYNRTPLEVAIKNGFIDAALLILEHSPSQDKLLDSNLFEQAFKMGCQEGIEKILMHPKLKIDFSKVASAAMRWHSHEVVSLLLTEKKINPNTFIQSAILACDLPLIDLLIGNGANINTTDNLGNTAFHYAIYQLNVSACSYLLNHFSKELMRKNHQNETPIDILQAQLKNSFLSDAIKNNAQSILTLILEKNLDVNLDV